MELLPRMQSILTAVDAINACIEQLDVTNDQLKAFGKYNTALEWVEHYVEKAETVGCIGGKVINEEYLTKKLVEAVKKAVPKEVREQISADNVNIQRAVTFVMVARQQSGSQRGGAAF